MKIAERPYFLKKEEWYYHDPEEMKYKLTKKATKKAIVSYYEFYQRGLEEHCIVNLPNFSKMSYSELVRKACLISFNAHKDDMDKGGYPYVYHPFFLATEMDDEYSTCVALLHDVIEDHGDKYSFDELEEAFPKEVLDALKLMTHKEDVDYMEYVKGISTNAIATKVKIADLKHNLDSRRTDGKEPKKKELYIEALYFLMNVDSK